MKEAEKVVIGNATLYCGDTVEVAATLEDKCAHHTITDPPYEEEAHSGDRRVYAVGGGVKKAQLSFDQMTDDLRETTAKNIVRLTSGWGLVFCQLEGWQGWRDTLLKYGANKDHPMVWCKPDGKPRFDGTGPAHAYEMIELVWCGDGRRSWNGGGQRGFMIENWAEARDGNIHQTIKPQAVMSKLVSWFSNKGETILDLYMGSGSTGVAAVSQDRKFIGIERDPRYFEICCKRIEKAQADALQLVQTAYVKTKAKVTVPLIEPVRKASSSAMPKLAPVKRVAAAPQTKRFAAPSITISGNVTAPIVRPKFDPIPAEMRALVKAANGQPFEFDAATWNHEHPKSAYGLDVECFPNWFVVCIKRFADGKRIAFELSDRTDFNNRELLLEILKKETIITFYGMGYDMPMVSAALAGAGNNELYHYSGRIIGGKIKYWEVEKELGIKLIGGINHVDLMEPNPSVKTGLKQLGARLHGKRVIDLPFDPSKNLSHSDMNLGTLYCMNDIDETQLVFNTMREPLQLRIALGKVYDMDFRSKSDAQTGEAIVKKLVGKKLGHTPKKPSIKQLFFNYEVPPFVEFKTEEFANVLEIIRSSEFHVDGFGKISTPDRMQNLKIEFGHSTYSIGKGGLHSTESNRAVRSDNDNVLIDIDVSSQYPFIVMKLCDMGIYPPSMGPAFKDVYGNLIKERIAAKAAGDKVKSEGGKIALNGVFGKFGSEYSALYAPNLLIHVTLTGQLSLMMMIEAAELAGIPVVSANTDGITFLCPRDKEELLKEVVKEWEQKTSFQVETTKYKAMFNSSVNTYIAWKENGKFKLKGPHGDPWSENDLRSMMMKNPQMTVLTKAVTEFIANGTSFEETIRACTDPRMFVTVVKVEGGAVWRDGNIGRVLRYYWSTDGEPIYYRTSNKKVGKTQGAKPLMEMSDVLPEDVDYDRYVEEAKALAIDLAVITEKEAGALV